MEEIEREEKDSYLLPDPLSLPKLCSLQLPLLLIVVAKQLLPKVWIRLVTLLLWEDHVMSCEHHVMSCELM